MTIAEEYRIHLAQRSDVSIIARQRAEMFRDMGLLPDEDVPTIETSSCAWLDRLMSSGEYVGWLVLDRRDNVVAGGGVLLREQGPVPGCPHPAGLAHVVNVFTSKSHRRIGIGKFLMSAILLWCSNNAVEHITLGTSEDARSLYESLGFVYTPELMKFSRSVPAQTPIAK